MVPNKSSCSGFKAVCLNRDEVPKKIKTENTNYASQGRADLMRYFSKEASFALDRLSGSFDL